MLKQVIENFFLDYSGRILKKLNFFVKKINLLEKDFVNLSDSELKKKTIIFKSRLKEGETLDEILPEAFSVVREASKRVFGMRHFDVQLLGGMVLHRQAIAEMRTGEGKTLTATLPVYLNALSGKGIHIVTMNDYLAKRDADKNKILFNFLGLTVGINVSNISIEEKKLAYAADITYGTNHEYGFDYLRDNMVFCNTKKVQRKLYFALVDEVDSILIDEARTPLIISGARECDNNIYIKINKLALSLVKKNKDDNKELSKPGDFIIDRKARQVYLTESGMDKIEKLLVSYKLLSNHESLYLPKNILFVHHILLGLKAHHIFFKNIDYIIRNKNIIIIDEHTGRAMSDRRWSEGLHQAIEAKENVLIHNENQTLASITLQNYFRLYKKLAGMTGTAITEEFEFRSIYNLETVVIPTNQPMIRRDMSDLVYLSLHEKYKAIISEIKECVMRKQPVLIGTVSVEKSELLSFLLKKNGIKHNVLNAKFHAQEADIIAKAGQLGAVTIATNMAGRGTDIVLGGNMNSYKNGTKNINGKRIFSQNKKWEKNHKLVLRSGGLHIIGTERHESRRIDNQLRGRSGRQGDPGSSRFYLSLEDPLLKLFSSNKIIGFMKLLGIKEDESIEHPWVNKIIENAQRKVECQNFDIRKNLLEYDNTVNEQRTVIYCERNKIIKTKDLRPYIFSILDYQIKIFLEKYIVKNEINLINFDLLKKKFKMKFFISFSCKKLLKNNLLLSNNINKIIDYIVKIVKKDYIKYSSQVSIKYRNIIEKSIILYAFDRFWRDHLNTLEFLRHSIYLRSYAQKDPMQEYKIESFNMFTSMLESIKNFLIKYLFTFFYDNFENKKYCLIKLIDANDLDSLNYFFMKYFKKKIL